MDKEALNNLVNGVGAMSEMTALYFKGLIQNGVPVDVAASLTKEFIHSSFPHM